jgi:RES domain-containing protein
VVLSVTVWRIVKQKHPPRKAFDGEGPRLHGGRWNSRGTPMVYTAGSQSLAALEMLVHLDSADLMGKYVFFEVTIEEALITSLETGDLPRNWRADPAPAKLRALGDAWVAAATSAVLRVPSSVIPAEHNYLLNPKHEDFTKLQFGKAVPFRYDTRLVERG